MNNIVPYVRSFQIVISQKTIAKRCLHTSIVLSKSQAARYRPDPKRRQPLTYEMANPPHYIAARKSWNSWNTSNVKDGNRPSETAVEDLFIRNFVQGTWPGLVLGEVIIKRQHNIIRIACIILRKIMPSRMYFLMGYTEQLLSYWLHCPIKMEIVTTASAEDIIYKTI